MCRGGGSGSPASVFGLAVFAVGFGLGGGALRWVLVVCCVGAVLTVFGGCVAVVCGAAVELVLWSVRPPGALVPAFALATLLVRGVSEVPQPPARTASARATMMRGA